MVNRKFLLGCAGVDVFSDDASICPDLMREGKISGYDMSCKLRRG